MTSSPPPGPRDFLDRLVDKALDQDRPLEPRVLSVFEPRPAHGGVHADRFEPEPAPSSSTPHDVALRPESRAVEPDSHRAMRERRGDERDSDLLEQRERGMLRAVSRSDEFPDPHARRVIDEPAVARGDQIARRPAPDRAAEPPAIASRRADAPPPVASPILPRPRRAQDDTEPDARGALVARERPEIAPAAPPMRATRRDDPRRDDALTHGETPRRAQDGGPPRAVLLPLPVPAVAPHAAQPSHQVHLADASGLARSESPTSVTVTIGRLEVRAVPASASPRPAARADGPRPLGLDDYLRQRGGGR